MSQTLKLLADFYSTFFNLSANNLRLCSTQKIPANTHSYQYMYPYMLYTVFFHILTRPTRHFNANKNFTSNLMLYYL